MNVQEKLKFEAERFFGSGMKRHWFTEFLYEAFHIETNLFIAHFNKRGFFDSRFENADGLRETIHVLTSVKPKNETHRIILQAYNDYLPKVQKAGNVSGLQELNAELESAIGMAVFIPLVYGETRRGIVNTLIQVQKQVKSLVEVEREKIV